MSYLSESADAIRKELERRPLREGSLALRLRALPPCLDLVGAIGASQTSPAMIGEVRRTSPFRGSIGPAGREPGQVAEHLVGGGAVAVSVATEPRFFDGSLSDVRAVRQRVSVPVLRRDILIHPAQVLESRVEGADAVVLVTAVLSAGELETMIAFAGELGMAAVAQVHSRAEFDRAVECEAPMVLLNARDPETLEVRWEEALGVARSHAKRTTLVLEGGIRFRSQVLAAGEAGAKAVLVGTALMRSDPEASLRRLIGGA
ncbi:indole-3-glycerol phosphate synthase TrpC [soil metagenome]